MVAPDRPGIGRSDPAPGRAVRDWAADVAALADALAIERFAVLGWSLGAQYALACAHGLGGRVTRAAAVAGAVPFDEVPGSRAALAPLDRGFLTASRWAPPLTAAALWLGVTRRSPRALQRTIARHSPPADREAMQRDPTPTAAADALREALRQGAAGVIRDYRLYGEPWGFALGEIGVEVGIWQGDADPTTPVTDAEGLAAKIPRSRLVLCPGEGHISLHRSRGSEYLGWLAARGRDGRE